MNKCPKYHANRSRAFRCAQLHGDLVHYYASGAMTREDRLLTEYSIGDNVKAREAWRFDGWEWKPTR